MKRGLQGTLMNQRTPGETFKSYIPNPLPPIPSIAWNATLSDKLEKSNRALGRLDGLSVLLPDLSLFLYYYVRKEAKRKTVAHVQSLLNYRRCWTPKPSLAPQVVTSSERIYSALQNAGR